MSDQTDKDLEDQILTPDEKRDKELDDSMDASDPPSNSHPDDNGDPMPSSGFKEDEH